MIHTITWDDQHLQLPPELSALQIETQTAVVHVSVFNRLPYFRLSQIHQRKRLEDSIAKLAAENSRHCVTTALRKQLSGTSSVVKSEEIATSTLDYHTGCEDWNVD